MNKKLVLSLVVLAGLTPYGAETRNIFFDFDEFFNRFENLHTRNQNQNLWFNNANKLQEISKPGSDKYVYQLAIPGSDENDVAVNFNDKTRMISISVKSHTETRTKSTDEDDTEETSSFSSSSQSFTESFTAPDDCVLESLTAQVENGLLTITIAKAQEAKGKGWQSVAITKKQQRTKAEAQ